MNDLMLPAPPDMIVFLPRHTITINERYACVHCHVLDQDIWNGPIPSGMTPDEFLELFTED